MEPWRMATAEPISTGLHDCLVGHFAYNGQVGRRKKEKQGGQIGHLQFLVI
jgi:hypothetical protein